MTSRQSIEFSRLHTALLQALFAKSPTTTHDPSTCAWPACGNRHGPPKKARIIERLPDLRLYTTADNRDCFAYSLHRLRILMVCGRHDGMAEKVGMPEEWIGDDDAAWAAVVDVLGSKSAHGGDKGSLAAGQKRSRGEEKVNEGQSKRQKSHTQPNSFTIDLGLVGLPTARQGESYGTATTGQYGISANGQYGMPTSSPLFWSGCNTPSRPTTTLEPFVTRPPSSSWSGTTNNTPPTPLSAASTLTWNHTQSWDLTNTTFAETPSPNIESTCYPPSWDVTNMTFADSTSLASQAADDVGVPADASVVCIICAANCDWVDDEGCCPECFLGRLNGEGDEEGVDGEHGEGSAE